ncbi:MAG: ChbG/HpnK family deacetylase [Nitrospinae bacterium]|nr:ChbG/HpnK family deacetylase [Nitrospinota bacterium]
MAMVLGNNRRQLIVTADDFNLSEGVSRGIIEAHRYGIVTETSVLVNLGDLRRAWELLAAAPLLGVGLHLNLTRGRPLAPRSAVAKIIGKDGHFLGSPQALPPLIEGASVREEFQAQLETFLQAFGRLPLHLDTHHHIHQHPVVLESLLDLATPLKLPVRGLDVHMRLAIRGRGLWTPQEFLGDVAEAPYWTVARLVAAIRELRPGLTELMCHPGYFDDAIAYSRYGRQREVERAALCDPTVTSAGQDMGVQLVTYAAVREAV